MAKKNDDLEPTLTVRDIARIWRVSERTVRRRIAAGELPAFKDGNIVRVCRSDFRAYNLRRMFR